jgi:signal peptidase I
MPEDKNILKADQGSAKKEATSGKTRSKAKNEPVLTPREEMSEFAKTIVIAVVLAIIIRTFLYEPFNIPSGSMKPTLLIGDYLFVQKYAYGYSRHSFPFGLAPIEGRVWEKTPQRGDVAVFKLPTNTGIDYIKRVVGLPGDTIQMRGGRLYINGTVTQRESLGMRMVDDEFRGKVPMQEYIETLPNGISYHIYEETDDRPLDSTDIFIVPEDHYFVMGDNRDNSLDSRAVNGVGFVPAELLVGKADFLFFSTNGHASLLEPWKWPWTIRYDRLFSKIQADDSDSNNQQSQSGHSDHSDAR